MGASGGGLNFGEETKEDLMREIEEETGIKVKKFLKDRYMFGHGDLKTKGIWIGTIHWCWRTVLILKV